jgi:prepilin-type N-terminal cleavage/methylation domain-containing protein|tara:strand:- start:22091 stop:22582 length:492 start_codon:yes stop_codon:yes gene_type:complete
MLGATMPRFSESRRAFSLIELVIVVVIIGIIGAIALPRMSRGAAGAADSSLVADLAVLRNAIELYQAEHGGTYPTEAAFVAQMTTYSDMAGATNATKDATHYLGPYLRSVPVIKAGSKKGKGYNTVSGTTGATVAWLYDETTGTISADLGSETDATGKNYTAY